VQQLSALLPITASESGSAAEGVGMIWQPIDTAPRDGALVLAAWFRPNSNVPVVMLVRWVDKHGGWVVAGKQRPATPVLWAPVPDLPQAILDEKLRDRFMRNVEMLTETGCWIWVGSLRGEGYGAFEVNGRGEQAHRISWQMHRGEIPEGANLLHRCDIRCCVNPDHLSIGSQRDNVIDMYRKGRWRRRPGERAERAV
jgi:hypothetical protein